MLNKTEIFEFLQDFVSEEAKLTLGIRAAITEYLYNGIRDANTAIQTINQQLTGEKISTLQFDIEQEKQLRAAAEEQQKFLLNTLGSLQQQLANLQNSGDSSPLCTIL